MVFRRKIEHGAVTDREHIISISIRDFQLAVRARGRFEAMNIQGDYPGYGYCLWCLNAERLDVYGLAGFPCIGYSLFRHAISAFRSGIDVSVAVRIHPYRVGIFRGGNGS